MELAYNHIASHLQPIWIPAHKQRCLEETAKVLANVDHDTVIGSGLSGALFVPQLAEHLGKNFAIVRKPGTQQGYSDNKIEGKIGKKWVFVDELICSGSTCRRVFEALKPIKNTEFVGICTYIYPVFRNVQQCEAIIKPNPWW